MISSQGQVFKLAKIGDPQRGGGKRGGVIGISRASRKRLLEKLARLDSKRSLPLFLTLTYPKVFPDCETARKHRRAFEKRLMRRWPGVALVWRLELQKRGAPHFHLLVWGSPFFPIGDLRAMWAAVIGYDGTAKLQVTCERIRSWRGVISYASKYIAKVSKPEAAGPATVGTAGGTVPGPEAAGLPELWDDQLDFSTYLAEGMKWSETKGRVWGMVNADNLPWAELVVFRAPWGGWFHQVKRLGRRVWPGVNPLPWAGFTLFRENPYRWFEVAGSTWAAWADGRR